jgi:hypothetical protein
MEGFPPLGKGEGSLLQAAESHTRRAVGATPAQRGGTSEEVEERALIEWAKAEGKIISGERRRGIANQGREGAIMSAMNSPTPQPGSPADTLLRKQRGKLPGITPESALRGLREVGRMKGEALRNLAWRHSPPTSTKRSD